MSRQRVTLLDGAVGTELSRRGQDTRLPLWSARPLLEAPEVVAAVHLDHVRAGCDVLTTCTFRTHERNLARAGHAGRADELNRVAVGAARKAISDGRRPEVLVAGSIAPLEDCLDASRVPPQRDCVREHALQATSLAASGVDLLLVETMNTRREAEAAVDAALATGLPTWCSFVTRGDGRLLSGEPLEEAVRSVEGRGIEAVLVNCVPAVDIVPEVARLRASTRLPVGAYGNIGHANDVVGWQVDLMLGPAAFAAHMTACVAAGAAIVGGCCGTEPSHLAELARSLGRHVAGAA
jgi:S-methylmethionine-dependent homocysteine/selenocysteine methylase